MRKFLSITLALAMALTMAACGGGAQPTAPAPAAEAPAAAAPADPAPAAPEAPAPAPEAPADPKVKLVYAEVNPADSLMGKTATVFKNSVEELSNGSIEIDIQFSGVLGAEGDVLDTMLGGGGTIDMTRISAFSLTSYGTERTALLSIPFTFEGREHFWNVANSDIGRELLDEPADIGLGVRGLFFVEEGFRHFFFNKQVNSIGDVAGTKIRVSTDPIMTGMVDGLGASATVVAFGELYTALSSGVVDGAEQPIANYQSNKFYEVADCMILDAHTLGCGEVIIMEDKLNELTDNQRKALEEASKIASEFNGNLSQENEDTCLAEMKSLGVNFVEVTDQQPWKDACQAVISEFSAGLEDDYNRIVSLK